MRLRSVLAGVAVIGSLGSGVARGDAAALSWEAVYTAELWQVIDGGLAHDGAYLDNLDVAAHADLEELWGWSGTRAHVYGLYNNGRDFSGTSVGDAQAVSNIDTRVSSFRLYEAWLETELTDRHSLKAGLYDLNSEFDVLPAAELFLNGAHGIGTDIGQTGVNGPSIFPVTSLALRSGWRLADHWQWRNVVLDAVPGDPDDPNRTHVDLGGEQGALAVSELAFDRAGRRLLLGGWVYSEPFEELECEPGDCREMRNAGAYLRGQVDLDALSRPVSVFGRVGYARDAVNTFEAFFGAGVVVEDVVEAWQNDSLGLAVAWAETGDRSAERLDAAGGDRAAREVAIELTQRFAVAANVAMQWNLQYVINPGASDDVDNAWVAGLRIEADLAGLLSGF